MDCDKIESNINNSKKQQLSKFSEAILAKKPLFNPG